MLWGDGVGSVVVGDGYKPDFDDHTAEDNPAFFKAAMQMFVRAGPRILRAATPSGVTLCRDIARPGQQVWATLKTGGRLLILGEVDPDELQGHYRDRCAALLVAQPDAVLVEGAVDVDDAIQALTGARAAGARRVGVTFAFGSGADRLETVLGTSCEEATTRIAAAQPDLLGCSSFLPIDEMVLAIRVMRAHTPLPLWAAPDAGVPELDGTQVVYRETPADFAAKSESLVGAGAGILAGGRGVTAAHIAAVVKRFGGVGATD